MAEPIPIQPKSTPPKATISTTSAAAQPLPALPYNPSDHKLGIFMTWTLIVTNSCLLPIALVYGLWYGTSLSKNTLFGIVTGVFGITSLVQFWLRMWKLLRKDAEYRPLGSARGWVSDALPNVVGLRGQMW